MGSALFPCGGVNTDTPDPQANASRVDRSDPGTHKIAYRGSVLPFLFTLGRTNPPVPAFVVPWKGSDETHKQCISYTAPQGEAIQAMLYL